MGDHDLRSTYDRVAGTYERRFAQELEGKPRDCELLDAFAASVGDPVADIGCGPGQIGAYARHRGRDVIGMDLSPKMAALAAGRLGAAVVGDMRALPFTTGQLGGLLAFYSLIHLRRDELGAVLEDLARVLRPGGGLLFSAHEGRGDVQLDEFLDEPVPFTATFFELDELVGASRAAGLHVRLAERRAPYPSESPTVRLYVQAERPGRAR